jgi:hypothetical protein
MNLIPNRKHLSALDHRKENHRKGQTNAKGSELDHRSYASMSQSVEGTTAKETKRSRPGQTLSEADGTSP